ncbi:endonuclease V isoform X2 [Apodemus sylvaticus]|uniref:endonuclease V isoform X2 n=1 Tax=Apodemus sylvaticus TaxID=10129 RepID=UPI002241B01D|nr:endonuclease V isoform X2 [Apodemus sylvaticus]
MAHTAAEWPPEETLSLWKGEQARLKARVVQRDTEAWQRDPSFSGLQKVGGVDVSFVKGDNVRACASLVVLSYPELKVVYEDSRMVGLKAPYVSGFLAFREVPFLVELVQQLQEKEPDIMPQVLLVDGNGVLHQRGALTEGPGHRGQQQMERVKSQEHLCAVVQLRCQKKEAPTALLNTGAVTQFSPRVGVYRWMRDRGGSPSHPHHPTLSLRSPEGFGVACHLGVLTELPCIGVAKKLLHVDGLEKNALHKQKIVLLQAGGDTFPLIGNSGTVLGMALKSHDHSTKPLYVSVGHRISLEVAVRLTHHCCRFRIPEPIRQADIRSREYIRRTLGHPGGSPAQRKDRSQKEQRPNTCPHGGPGAPADPGRPPEGSSTDPKNPEPGVWEKEDQQSEGPGRQEDSALWPPSPAWVQSPP